MRPWRYLQVFMIAAFVTIAADCFLKYVWWAACYSGWYGIPRLAQQAKIASSRASMYLWITVALEFISCTIIFSLIQLRYTDLSRFLRFAARISASAAITVIGTALLVFALGWVQPGIR